MAVCSRPRASCSFTCTLGKRSAYRGENVDKTLSIVCGGAATFSIPRSPRRSSATRSPSEPTLAKTPRQSASRFSPTAVKTRRRPIRSKSLKPNSCSRSLICRERADWLTCRRNPAFETVPNSATATNVRRRLRSMVPCLSLIRIRIQKDYALDARATRAYPRYQHPFESRRRSVKPSVRSHDDAATKSIKHDVIGVRASICAGQRTVVAGQGTPETWRTAHDLERPMSCCDETTARVPATDVSRRSLLKGAALISSVIPAGRSTPSQAQGKQIKLAYCSQLLCGVPYEVARAAGYFKSHGLDVQIVYTRGGNAAMQALVAGAVDYGATSLDVALQAYANAGAEIRRFAVTGRLPLFAIVTAPRTASQIRSIMDLEGKTVGVIALGTADHALTLYLLKQAGGDGQKVQFATMGVNLLEALRQGQIDAGLVQEPALTLLRRAGARVLVNAMDLEDAKHHLGGPFEFMGVAVRAKEFERRRPEMIALTKALADALKALRGMSGDQLSAIFPKEMTTGLDLKEFGEILVRHRDSLYPETVTIGLEAAKRVEQSLLASGLIKPGAGLTGLHDTSIVGG